MTRSRGTDAAAAAVADRGRTLDALIQRASALLARRPLLVASDFDGTLAVVRPDPWAARILDANRRALRRLAGMSGVRVVLFSGRTAADLAARTRIGGVTYLGDHGVERADVPRGFRPASMRIATTPASAEEERVARRLADGVPRDVAEPWLVVERKSAAVTFHFRTAPDIDLAAAAIRASADRHDPAASLTRHPGRRALELRPPTAATKASAMAAMIAELRPRSMLILGDGLDDAAAFRAVREIAAVDGLVALSLAVAGQADVTAKVAPHADGVLASPHEVGRLLGALASAGALVSAGALASAVAFASDRQEAHRSEGGGRRSAAHGADASAAADAPTLAVDGPSGR